MYNGIVNVYKDEGHTSHDVVARLRGIFGQKKIGHTGTLDPAATGVLPICLGSATKLVDSMMDKVKVYDAVMLLGVTTDTEDTTGNRLSEKEVNLSEEEIKEAVYSFVGKIKQVPPMFSAIKVNGQRLYDLARKGHEIEREARDVEIFSIDNVEINLPYVKMSVTCGKGTYIRSLCRDIGDKLGCGACMDKLIRTRVSVYKLEDAYTLSQLQDLKAEGRLSETIVSIDSFFMQHADVHVGDAYLKYLYNGHKFPVKAACGVVPTIDGKKVPDWKPQEGEFVRVYHDKDFYGIYSYDAEAKEYIPYKIYADRELLSGSN